MDCTLHECGVCASESVVAFCENCNFSICETCFQMHKKSTKLFQNHVAFLIENTKTITDSSTVGDDARDVSKESWGDMHTHKCATHTTENLVFFCTDHTETLCGRCVLSCHKVCKVVDLFEVNVDNEEVIACKSHLQNLAEVLKSTENKIGKHTSENNACKIEFLNDLQHLRTEVITWFDRLQSTLEKQCNETFETNAVRLTQVQTVCQAHIKRIQERQEFIDNLLTQNHVKKLYVLLKTVKQETEEIQLKLKLLNSEGMFNGYVFKRSSGIDNFLNTHLFEIGGLEEWCSGSDEILDDALSSLTVLRLGAPAEQSLSEFLPKNCDTGDSGKGREEDVLHADSENNKPMAATQSGRFQQSQTGHFENDEDKEAMTTQPATVEISGLIGQAKDSISLTNMLEKSYCDSRINSGQEAYTHRIKMATPKVYQNIEDDPKHAYNEQHAKNEQLSNAKYNIEMHGTNWCLRDVSTNKLYPQKELKACTVVFKSPELILVDGVYFQVSMSVKGKPQLRNCDDSGSDSSQSEAAQHRTPRFLKNQQTSNGLQEEVDTECQRESNYYKHVVGDTRIGRHLQTASAQLEQEAQNVITHDSIAQRKTTVPMVPLAEAYAVSIEKSTSWTPVTPPQNNQTNIFEVSDCINSGIGDKFDQQDILHLHEWEDSLKIPMAEMHYHYICNLRNSHLLYSTVSSIKFASGCLEAKGSYTDIINLKCEIDKLLASAEQETVTFKTDTEAQCALDKHINNFLDINITRTERTLRIFGSTENVAKALHSLVPIPWLNFILESPVTKLQFSCVHGDIRNAVAEFIAVSSTAKMSKHFGTSKHICDMLGENYIQECRLSISIDGEIQHGECRVIKSGLCVRRWIGNVVVPTHTLNKNHAGEILGEAYLKCFSAADTKKCETMAMTFFGSGSRGGFPFRECCYRLCQSLDAFKPTHLKKILLVEKSREKLNDIIGRCKQKNPTWNGYTIFKPVLLPT